MGIVKTIDLSKVKPSDATRKYEETKYQVVCEVEEIDELEDIMWTRDGYSQMNKLVGQINTMQMMYGDFSEVSLNSNAATVVKYSVVKDDKGNEVKCTRGEHPEFYQGWLAAIKRRAIFSASLDFERSAHKRESRYWIKGYLLGCRHLFRESATDSAERKRYPYAIGALRAYHNIVMDGLQGYAEDSENQRVDNVTLFETVDKQGYNDFVKVANLLWEDEMDRFF